MIFMAVPFSAALIFIRLLASLRTSKSTLGAVSYNCEILAKIDLLRFEQRRGAVNLSGNSLEAVS